jgi:hypothetical protein
MFDTLVRGEAGPEAGLLRAGWPASLFFFFWTAHKRGRSGALRHFVPLLVTSRTLVVVYKSMRFLVFVIKMSIRRPKQLPKLLMPKSTNEALCYHIREPADERALIKCHKECCLLLTLPPREDSDVILQPGQSQLVDFCVDVRVPENKLLQLMPSMPWTPISRENPFSTDDLNTLAMANVRLTPVVFPRNYHGPIKAIVTNNSVTLPTVLIPRQVVGVVHLIDAVKPVKLKQVISVYDYKNGDLVPDEDELDNGGSFNCCPFPSILRTSSENGGGGGKKVTFANHHDCA